MSIINYYYGWYSEPNQNVFFQKVSHYFKCSLFHWNSFNPFGKIACYWQNMSVPDT